MRGSDTAQTAQTAIFHYLRFQLDDQYLYGLSLLCPVMLHGELVTDVVVCKLNSVTVLHMSQICILSA